MLSEPVRWDLDLRVNPRLWPSPTSHVQGLLHCVGDIWDDNTMAGKLFAHSGSGDARAVRQTFEALAHLGLTYRTRDEDRLALTDLGLLLFTFLGSVGPRTFANSANVMVAGRYLLDAIGTILEVRVIWTLMRLCDDHLTNEELNRAMGRIGVADDIRGAAESVMYARQSRDPRSIGPRAYDDAGFTGQPSDQRKAINPHFLLAGGGGIFINVARDDPQRALRKEAIPYVDRCLRAPSATVHASTARDNVLKMSRHAAPPVPVKGWSTLL